MTACSIKYSGTFRKSQRNKPNFAKITGMEKTLGEQLSEIKLDKRVFGKLPLREGMVEIDRVAPDFKLYDHWKNLNYLRKHLYIIDKYLQGNKGETLNGWLMNTGQFLSTKVVEAIGGFNNNKKGITLYFLNLQQIYDEKEKQYDTAEAACLNSVQMPHEIRDEFRMYNDERTQKRDERKSFRNFHFKHLRKNKEGFFELSVPEVEINPSDKMVNNKQVIEETKINYNAGGEEAKAVIEKSKESHIGIYIAGAVIFIAGIFVGRKL